MPLPLLFCVAEEAKAASADIGLGRTELIGTYRLSQSYKDFRRRLNDDEPFESPFINASKEQCQQWAIENWKTHDFIGHDIGIADERTARDGTLLMSVWKQSSINFEDCEPVPPKAPAWYDFRVHHTAIFIFLADVQEGEPDSVGRIYYHYPEKLTDEAGAFDPLKVETVLETGKFEDGTVLLEF
ncbi:hypothetical protein N7490_011796 [Penicillium lividum]|nr:hypothetical protein N7490_011796 [Penicillium lividum]